MLGMKTREYSQTRSAADGLRQLILDGELRAGDQFTHERIATRLGVSRAPLRMALEQLKHQGILHSRPGGRFTVRSFSLREVEEAIHLRGQLVVVERDRRHLPAISPVQAEQSARRPPILRLEIAF